MLQEMRISPKEYRRRRASGPPAKGSGKENTSFERTLPDLRSEIFALNIGQYLNNLNNLQNRSQSSLENMKPIVLSTGNRHVEKVAETLIRLGEEQNIKEKNKKSSTNCRALLVNDL